MSLNDEIAAIVRAAVTDAIADLDLGTRAEPEPLMTTAELAEYLQVTTRTVQTLRESGMPARRIGDSWRYDRAEIDAWSRARARGAES